MNNNVERKLIYLLKSRVRDDKSFSESKNLEDFLKKLSGGQISDKLIVYLYNYLFKNTFNQLKNIKFSNSKIIVEELIDKKNGKMIKYNVIEDGGKISDIKRMSIAVKYGNNKKTTINKSIHYSLDSSIDIIVLETSEYDVSNSGKYDSIFDDIVDDKRYTKISYITPVDGEFKTYETVKLNNGTCSRYQTILVNDELLDYNASNTNIANRCENLTEYTKRSAKHLKELYVNEKEHIINENAGILNNDENLYDPDLYEFFEKMKDNVNGEYGASR